MALRPLEAVTRDAKIAKFLLSNPIKNTTMLFMWLRHENTHCAWMIVDGAFLRGNEEHPPPKVD